jgi:hypothetical protein
MKRMTIIVGSCLLAALMGLQGCFLFKQDRADKQDEIKELIENTREQEKTPDKNGTAEPSDDLFDGGK